MAGKGPLRYVLTGLLCAGLLVLIGVVQHLEIEYAERTAAIATSGTVGEPVDTGTFTLTVEDVRLAAAVTDDSALPDDEDEEEDPDAVAEPDPESGAGPESDEDDGAASDDDLDFAAVDEDDEAGLFDDDAAAVEADGLWVVVDLTLTATSRSMSVDSLALLDVADGLSYGSVALDYTLERHPITPGIPASGSLAFEVPEDRLEDPTVRVVAGPLDNRLAGEAKVNLGLDDAELETMMNEPLEVAPISAPTTA